MASGATGARAGAPRRPRGGKAKQITAYRDRQRAKAEPAEGVEKPLIVFPLMRLQDYADKMASDENGDAYIRFNEDTREVEWAFRRDCPLVWTSLGKIPDYLDVCRVETSGLPEKWQCDWIGTREQIARLRDAENRSIRAMIDVHNIICEV